MDSFSIFTNYLDFNWSKERLATDFQAAERDIAKSVMALADKTLRSKHLPSVTPDLEARFFDSVTQASYHAPRWLLWWSILERHEEMAHRLLKCDAPITPVAAYLAIFVHKLPSLKEVMIKADSVATVLRHPSLIEDSDLALPESPGCFIRAMAELGEMDDILLLMQQLDPPSVAYILENLVAEKNPEVAQKVAQKLFDLPRESLKQILTAYNKPQRIWDWLNQVGTPEMGRKLLDCFPEWPEIVDIEEYEEDDADRKQRFTPEFDKKVPHFKPEFTELLWEFHGDCFTFGQVLDIYLESAAPRDDMADDLAGRMEEYPGELAPRYKEFFDFLLVRGSWDKIQDYFNEYTQNFSDYVAYYIVEEFEGLDQATIDFLLALPAPGDQTEKLLTVILQALRFQIKGNLSVCRLVVERVAFQPHFRNLDGAILILMEEALRDNEREIFDYLRRNFPDKLSQHLLSYAIQFGPLEVFEDLFNQAILKPERLQEGFRDLFEGYLRDALSVFDKRPEDSERMQKVLVDAALEFITPGYPEKALSEICFTLLDRKNLYFIDIPEKHLYVLFKWCIDKNQLHPDVIERNKLYKALLKLAKENGYLAIATFLEVHLKVLKELLDFSVAVLNAFLEGRLEEFHQGLKRAAPEEFESLPAEKKAKND